MFDRISSRLHARSPEVSQRVIELAVEIASEGREARRFGTLFTVGDADKVLEHSRPLIFDPIAHTQNIYAAYGTRICAGR